jgi:catechol 2,3-dioxygenase-like lactoylglutathione lyase family enzyme
VSIAEALDHVAVVTGDIAAASADWERLGFSLTKLAGHEGAGTGNRCAMLRQGYIELIGTIDPARPSATLARFLTRHPGIHVVTFSVADEAAALSRLRRAGFRVEPIASERRTDGPPARFIRLPLSDADPRLQLLRHLTPELVWQERFLTHPNHAVALDTVVMATAEPAVQAARLSRVAGVAVQPDPAGGYVLKLAQGRVRILPPEAVQAIFPGAEIPEPPCVAGVVLRTDDGNAAVSALPASLARPVSGGVLAQCGGVGVLFAA